MSVERGAAGREDAAAEALGEAPALHRAEQPIIVVVEARPVVVVIKRRGAGLRRQAQARQAPERAVPRHRINVLGRDRGEHAADAPSHVI